MKVPGAGLLGWRPTTGRRQELWESYTTHGPPRCGCPTPARRPPGCGPYSPAAAWTRQPHASGAARSIPRTRPPGHGERQADRAARRAEGWLRRDDLPGAGGLDAGAPGRLPRRDARRARGGIRRGGPDVGPARVLRGRGGLMDAATTFIFVDT